METGQEQKGQMKIGSQIFDTAHHTYVMGILNVTPDSFSDGGKWNQMDAALQHTEKMIEEGAAIIDIGGESTRPGYTLISDAEEIERTAPIGSPMAEVIARHEAACCLMHNRLEEGYQNFMEDMKTDLRETVALAHKAQIREDGIMLDPGVGFAKSYENNLEAIRRVGELRELGYPVLLGTSRKSVVGLTLDLPAAERVEGTLVTTVFGVQQHCGFVRVHDVKENVRAIKMTEAIAWTE